MTIILINWMAFINEWMNFHKLTFSLVNYDYKTNSNRLEKKKNRLMSVGDSAALCIYHFNVYRPKMVRHILFAAIIFN